MEHAATTDRTLADYDAFVDDERRGVIEAGAGDLADVRVAHVNSTASGGGVAEMLDPLVALSNDVGVDSDWLVMEAPDEFFEVTKALHNGLQGDAVELTEGMRETYRDVTEANATEVETAYDVVVLHDPQAVGMIAVLGDRFPETTFVWRCHIDLTDADDAYLDFLRPYIESVDHAIFSRPEYGDRVGSVEKSVIHPAIDPLTEKNLPLEELSGEAARAADVGEYPVDPERPLLVQVSRFDPWKDPLGVVAAYRQVSESVPEVQLALVGGMPDDDPEGMEVYREVADEAGDDPDIHLLTDLPDAGVNAFQRGADVVLQKSLREGFALTVSEALWKETPVIGANVGGIPLQVEDGENGYLVEPRDVDGTAERARRLLADPDLAARLGARGRETVRERFLVPRLLVDYMELFGEYR